MIDFLDSDDYLTLEPGKYSAIYPVLTANDRIVVIMAPRMSEGREVQVVFRMDPNSHPALSESYIDP